MSSEPAAHVPAIVLAVSCAGGMARQYRVQVCDRGSLTPGNLTQWRLAGSFADSASADQCAERLRISGIQSRVVACRGLPTAA